MKTTETTKTIEFNGNDLILNLDNNTQLWVTADEAQVNSDKDLFLNQINFALHFYENDVVGFQKHMKINGFDVTFVEIIK